MNIEFEHGNWTLLRINENDPRFNIFMNILPNEDYIILNHSKFWLSHKTYNIDDDTIIFNLKEERADD